MKKIADILARGISAILYPLWIPTYGMLLFCTAVHMSFPLPLRYWLVTVGCTLLLTGLMPLFLILYQIRKGYITDVYIERREERTLAYTEAALGFGFWWYLFAHVLHAPMWLSGVALGATIAIILVAIINRWWKISAHLTGAGGLLGGLFAYALAYNTTAFVPIIIVMALILLLMYARLYLNAHTPWQVIAGLALGLTCPLLTSYLYTLFVHA